MIAKECPVPAGILVIVGGKEDKGDDEKDKKKKPDAYQHLEILKTFVDLTGKKNPTVEVITSASALGDESFDDYRKVFEELKVGIIGHIHHENREEVLADDCIERIDKADAIFFAGGDQLKYTSRYGGTHFLTRLKERYIHDKVVIGGTSAGAMAFPHP